jgi:hypothetical protein
MSNERRDEATKLLAQKAILTKLTGVHRGDMATAKAGAFDLPGVQEIGVVLGQPIGKVTMKNAAMYWSISDPAAFLAWVTEHRPDEVVNTPSVNAAFQKVVLDLAKRKTGDREVIDIQGEVVPVESIPGISYRQGDPTMTVEPNKDAERIILDLLGVDTARQLGMSPSTQEPGAEA